MIKSTLVSTFGKNHCTKINVMQKKISHKAETPVRCANSSIIITE